ncbi:site-specific DNA-methyltransferase [Calidifontibacillus erzurumensis]|uniref:site-specific DNA-methyltransferase n=1 Tax=Calidifontibacillus erzurumensis TaxID=2741433 RepID=UPI0035B565C1
MKTKEEIFLSALEDIFIGTKIESKAESGYINLMNIKAQYFADIKEHLLAIIDQELERFPNFREELFDKLYTFFSRYFNESGSIYFSNTPWYKSVYERVYSNNEDVVLFWKTNMLYYVKTDVIFKSMKVNVKQFQFIFDASEIEMKKNNEKRDLVFEFVHAEKNTIKLKAQYSNKKINISDLIKKAANAGCDELTEETLNKAIKLFKKQSEVDFFINKNAKQFLQEQFDLWLYQYMFKELNYYESTRINQITAMKKVAFHIIDFISQFEDELVKIWNKPKFVLNSNYIITKDKIEKTILNQIVESKGMEEQIQEWRSLGFVQNSFTLDELTKEQYQFLPFDTKYFPDLKEKIVSAFQHLDEEMNGWFVKSDSYHALNTLKEKFKGQVKCIYIDPLYNTGDDGFLYKDNFQHSTWLTMMENRLTLAREFLTDDGLIFISIDEDETHRLRMLLDKIFGEENFVNEIIWQKLTSAKKQSNFFSNVHDTILVYRKTPKRQQLKKVFIQSEKDDQNYKHIEEGTGRRYGDFDFTQKGQGGPRIFNGELKYPPEGKHWIWSQEKIDEGIKKGLIIFTKTGMPRVKRYLDEKVGNPVGDIWVDEMVKPLSANSSERENFETQKPVDLIKRIIEVSTEPDDIIMDFNAGTGTTAHAVVAVNSDDGGNRKYINVEIDEWFDTIMLPRIKRVIFNTPNKSGNVGHSHVMKYYHLEQYEDTLKKVHYKDAEFLLVDERKSPFEQYVFLRDMKMADALEMEGNEIKVNVNRIYPNIDLAETLSCLFGQKIEKLEKSKVTFENGLVVDLENMDYHYIKPLIWWC